MGKTVLTRVLQLDGVFDVWYTDVEDTEFIRTLLDELGNVTVNEYIDCHENEPVKGAYPVILIAPDTATEYLEDLPEKPNYVVTDEPKAYEVSQKLW